MNLSASSSRFLIILALVVVVASCSRYQKALKADNPLVRYNAAKEYFEAGKYDRTAALLETINSFTIGTRYADEAAWMEAFSTYKINQFILASHLFKQFAQAYPYSDNAEKAFYLYAYCLYLQSPRTNLDQRATVEGIKAFQLFINRFPKSERVEEATTLISLLENKLEKKAIDNALLFYQLEDYKSAAYSIRSVLEQFPATNRVEELYYLLIESTYLMAENSIRSKRVERYIDAVETSREYILRFPQGEHKEAVVELADKAREQLAKY